tara:strand:+ start:191 stop:742 length:552 start_codon:yes stop_codon:yes gene_type:complete
VSIFSWFYKKKSHSPTVNISKEIQSLTKQNIDLTSADIDPQGAALLNNYSKALELKKEQKLSEAEALLLLSTKPPSIYKGHYRELFKIWRQYNREDLKTKNYQAVIDRVVEMYKLDNEMVEEMLSYWSIQQKRKLPLNYFDKSRNLLISDAKALKVSAERFQQEKYIFLADELISNIKKNKFN